MKLLVTGGCGFIGSNFIRYWLKNHGGDHIVNLDKLTYAGHLSSTKDFSQNSHYRFIKGDIAYPLTVDKAMEKVDIVVHFAAESHVDRSIVKPSTFIKTNIVGTQVLLDAAVKHQIKRFHYVSTDEVFGSLDLDSSEKFDEQTVYKPHSPYSASKAAADLMVRSYFSSFGLPITITNASNNYGPFQDPEKLIPRFVTNVLCGLNVSVYGDGKYIRDWLHVEDHCRAIDTILEKGAIGETYCVGGQDKLTNNLELTKKILKIMGKNDSWIEYVADRAGHDRKYAVNWGKMHRELHWDPLYNLDSWLEKTVRWYQDNPWWWKPLKKRAEQSYSVKQRAGTHR